MAEQAMIVPAAVENGAAGFDYYAEAGLFPSHIKSGDTPNWVQRSDLATRRKPSASRSKIFPLSFFWEPVSKSRKRDITVKQFAASTRAWTIP